MEEWVRTKYLGGCMSESVALMLFMFVLQVGKHIRRISICIFPIGLG